MKKQGKQKVLRSSALARHKFCGTKFGRVNSAWFRGFTLIEMLVATAIFSMILVTIAASLMMVINSQRKTFTIQIAQENVRYILEYMIKEFRMSSQISQTNDQNITIVNSYGDTIDYKFDLSSKKLQKSIDGRASWQDVSPSDMELTGKFYITENLIPAKKKITIVMKVKTTGVRPTEIDLQSTVTARGGE